jgi:hypothetical protein
MAAIALFDPPKVDVPAVWSYYPNGLDPAPIGATTQAADPSGAWVARARPRESAVGSPQVVELGRVDAGGAFTSFGTLGEFPLVTDIAIASDRVGSVWIAYGVASADADGIRRRTWLERRVCP